MTEEQMNELAQNLMNELALGDDAVVRSTIVYAFKMVQKNTRDEVAREGAAKQGGE